MTPDEADSIRWGECARVATQEVSQHRWYTKRLVVFLSPECELRAFYHLDPATEDQEGQDEYELDAAGNVPTFPVVGKEVVTTIYEPA